MTDAPWQAFPYPAPSIWIIGAYIRISREDGNDESLSITNQKKIIGEFLEKFFKEPYRFQGFYIDDGQTATDNNRPGFQAMIRDVREGTVNCILCKNLSRMFRNYSDQGYFLETFFPMHRIRFITVSDPRIDSYLRPEAMEGLEIPINGLINDRYAAKTSRDIRDTFATKRRKGEFIGAFAPYGYKKSPKNKNRLIIDEEAASVVRRIYHWYVYQGFSKNAIARRLNQEKILNPTAYKRTKGLLFCSPQSSQNDGLWSAASVSSILKNQVYTGTMVQGRQTVISYKIHTKIPVPKENWFLVPNTHEEIVSESLYQKAQELSRRHTRTPSGQKGPYLFSGLLFCADCKKAMTRQKTKGIVYYYCRTYREKSRESCTKHSIREETVSQAILASLQVLMEQSPSLPELLDAVLQAPSGPPALSRLDSPDEAIQKDLDKINRDLDRLYEDWKNNDISKEDYLRRKTAYESRREQLRALLKKETGRQEESRLSESSPCLRKFLETGTLDQLNRGIITTLVDRIQIHEDGSIDITFRFSAPSSVLHPDMEPLLP